MTTLTDQHAARLWVCLIHQAFLSSVKDRMPAWVLACVRGTMHIWEAELLLLAINSYSKTLQKGHLSIIFTTNAEVIWSQSMLQGLFWHHLSVVLVANAGIVTFDSMLQVWQTALERQDLSHTYLAHHELESVVIIIIIIIIVIIIIIIGTIVIINIIIIFIDLFIYLLLQGS